ncbi:cyclin-dependent serine/threonine protein kinase SGV1 NDAI_0J00420 [Naumovozyma dairenensis CBS 421]|uniref:Serine/threonine-protein kinase BUR1 n=1 Tax=Naumovozyma dairenensis (strain ATCC 10597 / BCRC 20456 / CBS 421 / NBRC 0211 / NRRL Y-12639) TaxID=1071378 RepID=G0WGK6_NAUDC|nr:hypothetical protein NDAI_0J00420 [Naumovozyma dairenensis CBS 421]CCD26934.1 hypothetical protein NDAI_0J00420 [Naumovozyma dairenensis CBS 421]
MADSKTDISVNTEEMKSPISHANASYSSEFKYKIGKVKQTPVVQTDPKTGLTFIELKARPNEKVYGCTTFANNYREDKKLGRGTFGEVYKGIHLATQRQVAMKRILVNVEKDLFPITAQREITILKKLNHKNILKLLEMVYDYPPDSSSSSSSSSLSSKNNKKESPSSQNDPKFFYMILPYMVSDLSGILHNPRVNLEMKDIKNMMLQLLEGVNYIHCQKFMHRDIKAANILIDHKGIIKLADFGLARVYYGSPPNLKYPGGAGSGAKYTSVVVTRWYRAPELVLGDKHYTTAVDIWGVGCVFAELFEKKPILQGSTDIDQGHVIFKLLGTPTEEDWKLAKYLPGAELTKTTYKSTLEERFGKWLDKTGLDFLRQLLALDPYKRLTAMSAVRHPFFKEEPLPSGQLSLPCEESHEADIKRYKEEMHQAMSLKAPSAPQGHLVEKSNPSSTRVSVAHNGSVLERKQIPTGPGPKQSKAELPPKPSTEMEYKPPMPTGSRLGPSRYSQNKINQRPNQDYRNNYINPSHHNENTRSTQGSYFQHSSNTSAELPRKRSYSNDKNNNYGLPSRPANVRPHPHLASPSGRGLPQKPPALQINSRYNAVPNFNNTISAQKKPQPPTGPARIPPRGPISRYSGTSANSLKIESPPHKKQDISREEKHAPSKDNGGSLFSRIGVSEQYEARQQQRRNSRQYNNNDQAPSSHKNGYHIQPPPPQQQNPNYGWANTKKQAGDNSSTRKHNTNNNQGIHPKYIEDDSGNEDIADLY